jgi:CarD family transcriptional regulator
MYKVNDCVVYPGQGVAVIEDVTARQIGEKDVSFFKLRFLYRDMTILIPVDASGETSAMRPLCSKEGIKEVFNQIAQEPATPIKNYEFTPSSWNKRNKDYQLKIQGGKLIDLAQIYRDLMHMAKHKDLSFGEKNLLQISEELLVQEVIAVEHSTKEDVIRKLRRSFQQVTFSKVEAPRSASSSAAL